MSLAIVAYVICVLVFLASVVLLGLKMEQAERRAASLAYYKGYLAAKKNYNS